MNSSVKTRVRRALCKYYGWSPRRIGEGVKNFKNMSHRMGMFLYPPNRKTTAICTDVIAVGIGKDNFRSIPGE